MTGEKKPWPTRLTGWRMWVALALVVIFLYLVRSVLPPFLIGAVIAYGLGPVVANMEQRWRLPRAAAIALLYLGFLLPMVVFFVLLGPRLFFETRLLIVRAPTLLARIIDQLFGPGPYFLLGPESSSTEIAADLVGSFRDSLASPSNAIHLATMMFEIGLAVFLSLIVSIYLLLDSERVNRLLMSFVPFAQRIEVAAMSEEIHRTLARYLQRQMLLVAFVAAVTFIGLQFGFRLHYALPVAVATGFLEIVPFFGPVTAGAIAALIALSQGNAGFAIGVVLFYLVLRQIEDQIISPVVLGRAVELHPIVVIFAVLAGGALAGIVGTLVAVPVAATIKVILHAWPKIAPATLAPTEPLAPVVVSRSGEARVGGPPP